MWGNIMEAIMKDIADVQGLREFMHKYWPEFTSELLSVKELERLIQVKEKRND